MRRGLLVALLGLGAAGCHRLVGFEAVGRADGGVDLASPRPPDLAHPGDGGATDLGAPDGGLDLAPADLKAADGAGEGGVKDGAVADRTGVGG